ncbi:MAG: HD domain-containing protein [Pseudomonadota bacterium]
MFDPTSVVATAFGDHLADLYLQHFSGRKPEYAAFLGGGARLVLERLGNTDALYHNAEHTMMVTLVGQQIMRGRLLTEPINPEDWLHYTVACLVHDIGYARGACKDDRDEAVVINAHGDTVTPPRGASDAFLAPHHIDRGMIYARERFAASEYIDEERIARAVDFTRFPVPADPHYQATETEAALVRAADLIGQMGDPFYHRKKNALFYEFQEIGVAEELAYQSPTDLVERYPEFFWSKVQPYIGPALRYLQQTSEGKQWVAQLYNHVFQVEHKVSFIGPFPGPNGQNH